MSRPVSVTEEDATRQKTLRLITEEDATEVGYQFLMIRVFRLLPHESLRLGSRPRVADFGVF